MMDRILPTAKLFKLLGQFAVHLLSDLRALILGKLLAQKIYKKRMQLKASRVDDPNQRKVIFSHRCQAPACNR